MEAPFSYLLFLVGDLFTISLGALTKHVIQKSIHLNSKYNQFIKNKE